MKEGRPTLSSWRYPAITLSCVPIIWIILASSWPCARIMPEGVLRRKTMISISEFCYHPEVQDDAASIVLAFMQRPVLLPTHRKSLTFLSSGEQSPCGALKANFFRASKSVSSVAWHLKTSCFDLNENIAGTALAASHKSVKEPLSAKSLPIRLCSEPQ